MLYNKNNVRKTNDKKILHKVGKQWKVVSVALLMAIGGTAAVATHANAQSTNANNNNNSANAEATVSKNDMAHHLQGPVNVAPQSVAPKSANSTNSASAKSSAITYLHTEGGSAASANAAASQANVSAKSNANVVNSYVKSLNAKFPTITNVLTSSAASANDAARRDNAAAHHYSAVANNSANKSAVSSLAAKSGYTASDYEGNVQWNTQNIYAPAVKSASDEANAFNMVSSLANNFEGADLNTMSVEAQASSTEASVNSQIANAKFNAINVSNAQSSVTINNSALAKATVNSIKASGAASAAMNNSSADSSAVVSFAQSLYGNSSNYNVNAINSAVAYYAKLGSVSSSTPVKFATEFSGSVSLNDKGSAVASATSFGTSSALTSALNGVINDSAVMSSAASTEASANSAIASANAHKAIYSANYASANSASQTLSAEISSANDASLAAGYVVNAFNNLTSNGAKVPTTLSDKASMAASLLNVAKSGSAALESALGINGINSHSDLGFKADLASMASADGINAYALKSAAPAIKALADAAPANINTSNLSSAVNSLASTVNSNLVSANSASANYANLTHANIVLASYYASSYSNDASSEASEASNAQNDLAAFYTNNADAKYASATNAVAENNGIAKSKLALAKKLGLDVYATAPKFITITKDGLLHASANYGSANDKKLGKVEKGDQYQVNSIGIANNGAVRFNITLKNGQSGYFTDAAGYVEPTYYEATPNNRENVKALKTVRLYKDLNRTQYAGKTIAKGDTLSNDVVTAVSVDGNFGGYTVFEDLKSGEFFTSNVKCVSATPVKAANNNQNNNNNKPVNPVQFF